MVDVYRKVKKVKSKEEFIEFLLCLSKDNHDNNDEWENLSINDYLSAISSWVEDMEGYYENCNLKKPDNIDWNFIATLFYVGKIYE